MLKIRTFFISFCGRCQCRSVSSVRHGNRIFSIDENHVENLFLEALAAGPPDKQSLGKKTPPVKIERFIEENLRQDRKRYEDNSKF